LAGFYSRRNNEKEKKMVKNKRIYILSLIITTIVFLSGIGIGSLLSKEKTNILEQKLRTVENEEKNAELQWLMLEVLENEESCNLIYYQLQDLVGKVDELAEKVVLYENREEMKTSDYTDLKKDYTAFQVKYWLFVEKIRRSCPITNKTFTTILFFYSEACTPCENQGFVLSYLKSRYPNVMVYALDSELDYDITKNLKSVFNVTKIPTLIINAENKLEGVRSFEELKEYVS